MSKPKHVVANILFDFQQAKAEKEVEGGIEKLFICDGCGSTLSVEKSVKVTICPVCGKIVLVG